MSRPTWKDCSGPVLVWSLAWAGLSFVSGCTKADRTTLARSTPSSWGSKSEESDNKPVPATPTSQANAPVLAEDELAATGEKLDGKKVAKGAASTARLPSIAGHARLGSHPAPETRPSVAASSLEPTSPEFQVDRDVKAEEVGDASDTAPSPTVVTSDLKAQQLKKALSEDVTRGETSNSQDRASQPIRIRTESLMTQAQQALEEGQLQDGRRLARQAVELADKGQVQFLPTEERPLDMLRDIERMIEQRSAAPGSVLDEVVIATMDSTGPATTTTLVSASTAAPSRTTIGGPSMAGAAVGWTAAPQQASLAARTDAPDEVRVTANRPVTLETSATEEVPAAVSSSMVRPQSPSESRPVALSTVAVDLPPFRGSQGSVEGPVLELPEIAPAPPTVDDPEPWPAMVTETESVSPTVRDDVGGRPLFTLQSLLMAGLALGVICSVVGLGLMVRSIRERR